MSHSGLGGSLSDHREDALSDFIDVVLGFRRRAVHDSPVEIKQIPDVLLNKVDFGSVDLHASQVLEVAVLGVGDQSV